MTTTEETTMARPKMGLNRARQLVAVVERARAQAGREIDEVAVLAAWLATGQRRVNRARAAALLRMARAVLAEEGGDGG